MAEAKTPTRARNRLDWLMQTGWTTWRLFSKNELYNHAAAVSLYFLLSAAPLLMLTLYASQWVERWAEGSIRATILLAALYDQFHLDTLRQLGVLPERARLAAGGVGLLTLLLASRGLLNALQGAFRVIFPTDSKRRFVVSWAIPLLIVPLAFLLILLGLAARGVLEFLAQPSLLGSARAGALEAASTLLTVLTVWALTFFAYWRLPLKRPPLRATLWVSALAALSLVILASGFGHFFSAEKYRALYGSLAGVVFVLIGIYFLSLTFFAWAQCLYAVTKVDVAALERLFLGSEGKGANRLENLAFSGINRLLDKYGQTLPAGSVLIHEGDRDDLSYYLYRGRVALYKGGAHGSPLGHIEQGELFGEMAYLLGEPRSATVVAETDITVLALPPQLLEELMRYSAPFSRRIIGSLCQRLKVMNLQKAA
ncbi:MAG: YhjD/YihY/BrkB family envelope integrity protein [Pseudomonadota bacterium]